MAGGSLGRPEPSSVPWRLREASTRSKGDSPQQKARHPVRSRSTASRFVIKQPSPAAPSAEVLNALQTAVRTEREGQMQSRPALRVTSDFTSLRIQSHNTTLSQTSGLSTKSLVSDSPHLSNLATNSRVPITSSPSKV